MAEMGAAGALIIMAWGILPADELGWHTEAASDMANPQYSIGPQQSSWSIFESCMAGSLRNRRQKITKSVKIECSPLQAVVREHAGSFLCLK
jgi:hypothetical protein